MIRRDSLLLAVWVVVLFSACLALNTRHNRFPYYYHRDEPGKVEQIMEGKWNLHHPPLLLGLTKVLVKQPLTEQGIVEAGRFICATLVSLAVVALSILAYHWRGWPAALTCGAALAWHHQLYELSHYFKEDPALLFGLSLSFLAMWLYNSRPTSGSAAFLGAACAVALSAKYVGVIGLLLAIPVMIRARGRAWSLFLAAFLAVVAIANLPIFTNWTTFQDSFSRETDLVIKGQGGSTQKVPHSEYWTIFRDNTTPVVWVLLLVFLANRWRERRQLDLTAWLIVAFPFAYAVALSFSPKANDRYFLPASAMLTVFAAIGACDLARRWRWSGTMWISALLLVSAELPSWSESHPGWLAYERAFQRDDNAELIKYLRTEVPPDAVLLKDNAIALPDPKKQKHAARVGIIPQRVIARRYAADFGPFDTLKGAGITHVIVTETDYGRYFRERLKPQKGQENEFAKSRDFYQRLFKEAELLNEWDRSTVIYLHPGIRIYRLR